MKNYLIIGGIILISIVGIWILAASSDEQAEVSQTETSTPQEPEAYDASAQTSETVEYTSDFNPDLRLSYPENWNISEGADNSAEQQLVTFESPPDANGYYFCLDLTEVSADSDADFMTTDTDILAVDSFTADGIGKTLSSVLFKVEENGNLLWSIVDGEPTTSQSEFDNSITSPAGRRLQTLGRFNCRETDSRVTDADKFQNSRWFNQARAIAASLTY